MEIVKKFYAIGFAGILLEVFGKNSVGNSKFMSHFEWDSVISIGDSDDLRQSIVKLCSGVGENLRHHIIDFINQLMDFQHANILKPVDYADCFRNFMDQYEIYPIESQQKFNYIST